MIIAEHNIIIIKLQLHQVVDNVDEQS